MKFSVSAKNGYKGKHAKKGFFHRYKGRKFTAKDICAFIVFILGFIFCVGGIGAMERDILPLVAGCVVSLCGTSLMALVMVWTHGNDNDWYEG